MNKIVLFMSIIALTTIAARRSEAIGSESLGCYVNVGLPGVYRSPICGASRARPSYDVPFQVLSESGTYTFAWTTSGGTVTSGCTSTSDFCILHTQGVSGDQTLSASVTLTQGGQQRTVSAHAFIPAVCGNVFC